MLREEVSVLRRDQLNYSVERDLLKEVYGSSFQTIGTVLTIVLGAFTILGYLGLRSLADLRGQFHRELSDLREAKADLRLRLKSLRRRQAEARLQVSKLTAQNKSQDNRLQLLEIQEKINSLFEGQSYARALEYAVVGVGLAPGDPQIRFLHARCLSKLGRFPEAIASYRLVIASDPKQTTAVTDLIELLILEEDQGSVKALMKDFPTILDGRPLVIWYFEALRLGLSGDLIGIRAHVKALLALPRLEEEKSRFRWQFAEVRTALAARKGMPTGPLLMAAIDFLENKIDSNALSEKLK